MSAILQEATISPAEFAQRYSIGLSKVLAWLHDGQLTAIDVSLGRGRKPRWRIRKIDIESFEASRSNSRPPKRRPSPKSATADGVQFFAEK